MINPNDSYANIFNQRHPSLEEKNDIWELIHKSYKGGIDYKKGPDTAIVQYDKKGNPIVNSYLWKYPREGNDSYEARTKRAVYFNQISPLADMLAGFLFKELPTRNNIESVLYLLNEADIKKKSFDNFMMILMKMKLYLKRIGKIEA
jgi:hypothetical protein